MVRKLIPALVLLAAHFPGNALALGVGNIHLESALNQEFDAYIDLLSVKSDELDGVKVKLATPDAFERAGMDRPYVLSKLRFVPEIGPEGKAVIRVSSREPIREPFLNFLVEVNWAKGRLVREYTVLLDPPVTLERKPAPVSRATTTAPAPAPELVQAPAPAPEPEPVSAPPVRPVMVQETPAAAVSEPDAAAQSEYGPVQATDTLWSIANAVKPEGTSVYQTMMALLRSNPHAFSDNNVNNLKKGAILRIPDRGDIEYLSNAEAMSAFQSQMDEWRASHPTAMAQVEATEEPAPEAPATQMTPEPEAVQPESQLKLVSARPEAAGEAGASEGEEDLQRQIASLENSLAMAREEAASSKEENKELTSRLKALEEQLAEAKRIEKLVTVRDEQLAALQAVAEKEEAQVAEEVAPAAEEPQPAPAEETEAPAPEAAAAPEPEPEPMPAIEPRRKAASTVDQILSLVQKNQTLAMGAGGGLLLLILLLLLLKRRKGKAEDFEESMLISPEEMGEAKGKAGAELPEEEEGVGGETSLLSEFASSDMDARQEDTGEVDPVAEADVYIAYGRFQQAEELVSQAIEREPNRLSLKHKMLEIYSAAGNSDAFTKLAEKMAAQGAEKADSAAWSKALAMGAKLAPAHALFAGVAASTEAPAVSESVDAELDELATELGIEEETQEPEDELSDLDLDLNFDEALEELEGEEDKGAAADEGLDFDFDLGGTEPEEAPELGEGLSLEQEEEGPEVGLADLSADDLMPEQLVEAEETPSADDLAKELEGLSTDLDLGGAAEPESAGLDEGMADLGGDLDLGSVEGLDLGGEEPDLGMDLSLDEDLASADLEAMLSGLTEGGEKEPSVEDDLEQTLSSLTEGLDLELDAETEDLEQTLSSLTGDLDLGGADNIDDLEQTLSGFSESVLGGESEDLLSDISADDLMGGALGEESASTQLLDMALEEDEDADEVTTKLDLAKAYVEMGDSEGARSILEEVLGEGNDQQKADAQALIDQLS